VKPAPQSAPARPIREDLAVELRAAGQPDSELRRRLAELALRIARRQRVQLAPPPEQE